MQPLPDSPFILHQIKPVKVHPDCHVVLDGSYYSAPYHYIGQKLDAYVSDQMVELYRGTELVATHVRCTKPGQWQTRMEDYPPEKAAYLIQTPTYCRRLAADIGPSTLKVVETLLAERPLERLRAVQAILALHKSVGPDRLEAACARALHFGDVRYRRIKNILNAIKGFRKHHPHRCTKNSHDQIHGKFPGTDQFVGRYNKRRNIAQKRT